MDGTFGQINYWGRTLPCLRSVPVFLWGCMLYGICSATWLVRFASRVLFVVPMMPYLFSYCELLLLYIVGLVVYSSNQNLHRYVCKLISGDDVFIIRSYSDLLFLDVVVICTTILGGCFHLHCIVMI